MNQHPRPENTSADNVRRETGRAGPVGFSKQTATLIALLAIGVAYFALAKGGLMLASLHASATPIWPASGFALAAILLWGYRVSPAILVAAFVANVTTAGSVETSLGIAIGNTLEALAGGYLIDRYSAGRHTFDTPAGVARFALVCPIAAAVSATVGVLSLAVAGFADWADFPQIWMTWWLGDLGGIVVVAPVVILWATSDAQSPNARALWQSGAVFLVAALIGLFAFSPIVGLGVDRAPLGFLAILPLVWAALRQGQRDTATVALILSGLAIWGTVSEGGSARPLNESFLLLVGSIIGMTVPSLALAAGATVHKATDSLLRRTHEALESRFQERTAALAQANEALKGEIESRKQIEAERARDVAARERAQQALIDSERRFRLLVQSVTDHAIFMLDTGGRVTNWNAGAERIKGYTAEEITGKHVSVFHTAEDRARGDPERALEAAVKDGKYEAEGWRVRKDGSQFWASVVIEAIRDEESNLLGFAKITRDFTERRKAQAALDQTREQLLQAQKLEALGQLTGGVAHDFNNLLAALQSGLSLIERNAGDKAKLDRLISEVRQAAKRGEGLTRQLLTFSRRQPLQPEVLDVSARIKTATGLFGPLLSSAVRVVTELPEDLPPVRVDPSQFELAVLNICLNARDAMPNGGTLTIRGRTAQPDAAGSASRRYVDIEIADTGVGIPDEIKSRVFEPFFTTKEVGKGSGLGLSQAYGFSEQSGGMLRLESTVGKGTSVTIRLPAADADLPGTAASPEAGQTGHSGNILLIEDDKVLAGLTAELFEQAGYSVTTVHSAAAALAELRENGNIDAIFSDIVMPGGMNGLELARAIRSEYPGTPVLLATGFSGAAATADAHGVEIVPKPYDSTKVLMLIAKMIARAGRAAPAD